MLMAAGLGTRLRPFTEQEPKALLPVMGIPCAWFSLQAIRSVAVRNVIANVHHCAARARQGLCELDPALRINDESAKLLGSAGGIAKALPALGAGPFFLVNADVLCDLNLRALARAHAALRARHGVKLTLAVFPGSSGAGTYREILLGDQKDSAGLVRGLGELEQGRPYFVGTAVIEPEAFSGISPNEPSELVPRVLEPAIREGKAGFFLSSGIWLDIGSPALWAEAHFDLIERIETGRISQAWRREIEANNSRVGQRMWTKKGAEGGVSADWRAPAYFHSLDDSTAVAPRLFGSRAVLYGREEDRKARRFENEIGFRGQILKLS